MGREALLGGHGASQILTSEMSHRSVSVPSFDGKCQLILTFLFSFNNIKGVSFCWGKNVYFDLIISICVILASEADENTSSKMGMYKSTRYTSCLIFYSGLWLCSFSTKHHNSSNWNNSALSKSIISCSLFCCSKENTMTALQTITNFHKPDFSDWHC